MAFRQIESVRDVKIGVDDFGVTRTTTIKGESR